MGSPARARKRQARQDVDPVLERFTRARAEETDSGSRARRAPEVHPRARGRDVRFSASRSSAYGPPARARKRLRRDSAGQLDRGSTRARAEETQSWLGSNTRTWVHPRARGRDSSLSSRNISAPGPPARARKRHKPHFGHVKLGGSTRARGRDGRAFNPPLHPDGPPARARKRPDLVREAVLVHGSTRARAEETPA